jgi:hypothetical protein
MTRYFAISLLTIFLNLIFQELQSQSIIPFGDIKLDDLSNRPYKPDPGADAIILSDIGIASVDYGNGKFYVEFVRDVKIKIVNSNGFDYADIEIPLSSGDELIKYQASTFNLRNGEKVETKIPKKSFILEKTTLSRRALKFNFPDVHEGSVIEYSYRVRLGNYALSTLVSWEFQSDIPVVNSSFAVAYPEFFQYKMTFSGSSEKINYGETSSNSFFNGLAHILYTKSWTALNMPAFKEEPLIKSKNEHLSGISFELASLNFPDYGSSEITPSYATLTLKLLERNDFGMALKRTAFLKKTTSDLIKGLNDDMTRLKKIHHFVSTKLLYNGIEDYTASSSLQKVFDKEVGNSADINMIFISMLRAANIKADPVILSTRSNGSLNQYSAIIQQFNYLVAYVNINNEYYVVDATDPVRPFNLLPFDCLNNSGRLIAESGSRFIDLKNKEKKSLTSAVSLVMDAKGIMTGDMENRLSGYTAYNVRKSIRLEGEEGYLDTVKSTASEILISDFRVKNLDARDSDLILSFKVNTSSGVQKADDKILFNPSLSLEPVKTPFYSDKRNFPIDFGCPSEATYFLTLEIPEGYRVIEKPDNIDINVGKSDCSYQFKCSQTGNILSVSRSLKINKTVFQPSEYTVIQDFYSKVLLKGNELIVLGKNSVTN